MVKLDAINPRVFEGRRCVISVGTRARIGLILTFLCSGFLLSDQTIAQQAAIAQTQWLTGKELDQASLLATSGEMTGGAFRQRLMEFAKRRKTAVFLDRQADPTVELNVSLVDLTFEQFIWKVADANGLGVCRVGDLYYIGPPQTAAILPVLFYELKDNTSSRKERGDGPNWRAKSRLSWPDLSEPRQLIEQLAGENGLRISNPNLIPHDMWFAADFPPSSLEERLALLLVGFDLWFEKSALGVVKLVPLPVDIKRGTRVVKNVSDANKLARELRQEFVDCKIRASGRSLKITGPVSEIDRAARVLVDRQTAEKGNPALSRFSLDTTASRGSILTTVAKQMGLEFSFAPDLKSMLSERVTVKITQQPIEIIVAEILKGTKTEFTIENETLTVTRKK